MLFVMDKMEEQSFWMLNTYIALDIIFGCSFENRQDQSKCTTAIA
ncbi:MAG: DUF192 domain-containing protein [Saprospiraceae bacterium]|nr:DUF192 domain-containing protein [Saprospiraceae bacterium]